MNLRGFLKRFAVVGAFLVLSVGQAKALTLSQVRDLIRLHIKDTNSSRQRYSDTQLNLLINEAQRDVNNSAWVCRSSYTFELVSGTTFYSLPSDTMDILRVTWLDKNLPETSLEQEDAAASNSAWQRTGGAPQAYFQDPAQVGFIGFKPFPNSATSTGTIKMNYVAFPATLSSDSDTPFNANPRLIPYHDLLVFYPCYKIFLIEGDQIKFNTYAAQYESRLMALRDTYGTKPNYHPGFSGKREP